LPASNGRSLMSATRHPVGQSRPRAKLRLQPLRRQPAPEMSQSIVVVLIALGLAYVAFAVVVMSEFSAYCDRLAKVTGRERERQSIWNTDEGGLSAFDREQFWKLMRGDYLELADPVIAAQARRLTLRCRLSYLLGAVLLVVIVAATKYWPG
jgi:hypothetical protein